MDGQMKFDLPKINAIDHRTLRIARAKAQSRWTNGGRIRSKQPAPITLRLKDRPIGNA
jgi:hypothetical protein